MTLSPAAARLDGLVAVVTGGGGGIGRGIALGLQAFGAEVAIWERDPTRATLDHGLALEVDVREPDAVEAALAATTERFGRVDVLVNNAGGVFAAPFLATSLGGFDALHRANLRQVLVCSQAVAAAMVTRGAGGSIVNVTSIEGTRAAPGYAAYAAAKAGVISLTKTLAIELAPHGIRVNAIAPDITWTEGLEAVAPPGASATWADRIPLGRVGHVDEIAGAAVFLASSLSGYVTGQTLHVDGGTSALAGFPLS